MRIVRTVAKMKTFIVLTLFLCYGSLNCQTISDVLTNLHCSSFLARLNETGLIDELNKMPEITILAPSNQAMETAGEPSDENLLKYHIISETINSSDISNDLLKDSLHGATIRFNIYNESQVYTAQGAMIDLDRVNNEISNGTIHVLDTVMNPPTGTIFEYISITPGFLKLKEAVENLNLTAEFNSTSEALTVFAPNDAAFSKIPATDMGNLENTTYLREILYYHVANGTHYRADLTNGNTITTLRTDLLLVDVTNDVISLKEAGYSTVTTTDVSLTNGVLHIIDRVLEMPEIQSSSSTLSLQWSLVSACLLLTLSALKW